MTDIFFGTSGPRDAAIAIVGESWGSTEADKQKPFVGQSGQELTRILADAGINRDECFMTNVVAVQPPGNDMTRLLVKTAEAKKNHVTNYAGVFPRDGTIRLGVETLIAQLEAVRPRIVIALGNWPLWALTHNAFRISDSNGFKVPTGIASWRGSQLYSNTGIPLVPTYHPAAILRKWDWRQVAVHDLKTRVPKVEFDGRWHPPLYDFRIRPVFDDVMSTIADLMARAGACAARGARLPLSVDLETRATHIACAGIAWSRLSALCIPLMCVERDEGYWTLEEETAIIFALRKLLQHPAVMIIGQNFLYDSQYIARYWCFVPVTGFDTMVAQHLCFPGLPKGLDYLSSMYCEFHEYWKDEGKTWDYKTPEEQLWGYNCKDAVVAFEVYEELTELIAAFNLEEQWQWECAQLPLMLEMMLRGVLIDRNARIEMQFELDAAIQHRAQRLEAILPWSRELVKSKAAKAWYFSPKQQQKIFYEELGIKPIRNRKTRRVTIDDDALERVGRIEPLLKPVTQMLQELRSARVFNNTFLAAKLDADNRMRCSFNVHPETFRWSSSESAFGTGANLQTIPRGTEDYEL